jgi:ArsR family transcriptional regulator, arsenate/arsenite/antimonite-responsive transcriptional repressor
MIEHVEFTNEQLDVILDMLNALNDKTRQNIIMLFQFQKEYCANDIASKFKLSRPTISHHLNLMKRSKILNARKDGKEIYYSLNKDYIINNLESVLACMKSSC